MENTWYSFQQELENFNGNYQTFSLMIDENNSSQERDQGNEDEESSQFSSSYQIPMELVIGNQQQSFRPLGVIIQKDSQQIDDIFFLFNIFGILNASQYGQPGVISIGRAKNQDICIDNSDIQASKEHCQIRTTTCSSSSGNSKSMSILTECNAPSKILEICELKEKNENKDQRQQQDRLLEKNRMSKELKLLKGWVLRQLENKNDQKVDGKSAEHQSISMMTCLKEESIFKNICEFASNPQGLILMDLETKIGTQIQVNHIYPSQLRSNQSYMIGQLQKFFINEINNLRYYDDFAYVIANCILENMKLNCLNDNITTAFSENSRVFIGLNNEETHQFEELLRFVSKEFVISFQNLNDSEFLEQILDQIRQSLKSYYELNNQKIMDFRPYIQLTFLVDEGSRHSVSFFLFEDGSTIDRVYTIGRDQCDILINSREVSRKNTEIFYKNSMWCIRDGSGPESSRKESLNKTWRNLTRLSFSQDQESFDTSNYLLKNKDVWKCSNTTFSVQYF